MRRRLAVRYLAQKSDIKRQIWMEKMLDLDEIAHILLDVPAISCAARVKFLGRPPRRVSCGINLEKSTQMMR